jgi:hypothetical protein
MEDRERGTAEQKGTDMITVSLSYVSHFCLQDSNLYGGLMYIFTYEASSILIRLVKA